jgi:hypothetical protein
MLLKQTVKNLIGEKNARRVVVLRDYVSVFAHRSWRSCKFYLRGDKTRSAIIEKLSVSDGQTFFGYYDVTPFSKDNNIILAMVGPHRNRPPAKNEEIAVGYFDRTGDGCFQPVDKSSTWCWQMGCRLQWFPEDENELVIYNKTVDGAYGSVVQNIKTKKILRSYKKPIYQIDRTGKWALFLNFSRLHRLRPGYGYRNIADSTEKELCPNDDGVSLMDLVNCEAKLIVSLKHLSQTDPVPSMEGAEHYINHLAFNPSGNRFMFFHLWVTKSGRRHNRLITCDRDGSNLYVLENEGLVSHYCWKSDTDLLATVYYENEGMRYVSYRDLSNEGTVMGQDLLFKDGHPSYSPDSSFLLTDTYPDKYREQHVLIYRFGGKLVELARFFSPVSFRGEVRCDLHPRWDRTGQNVCVDSGHDGRRALYVIGAEAL